MSNPAECLAAWENVMRIIVESGASDEFIDAVKKSAEIASRAAAATYQDERVHLRMSVKAEFCYELADLMGRAQEESEAKAKVDEAERIREHLASM